MPPRPLRDLHRWLILAALVVPLVVPFVVPLVGSAVAGPVTPRVPFGAGVASLLRARCVGCHGREEASGGLRLDSYDAVMRGGERGPAVVPGNAAASLLLRKVLRRDKPAMPPRKPLSPREVGVIRQWIESGAGP